MYVTISITGRDMLESNELYRDMSLRKDTFMYVIQHFAAFATGLLTLLFFFFLQPLLTISIFQRNISIGNLQHFLLNIIKMVVTQRTVYYPCMH